MDKKLRAVVLFTPILLIYGFLILGGFYYVLIESMGYIPKLGFDQFTFKYYIEVLFSNNFWKDFLYSFYLAATSTLIASFCGVFFGYYLTNIKGGIFKTILIRIIEIGIVFPYLYITFVVMVIFNKTGIISRFFYNMDIINTIDSFPSILYSPFGFGIIIVFFLKGFSFISLFVYNIMTEISNKYSEVANTLGANKLYVFKKIYIPLSANTIIWTSIITFSYYLGSFEVPYILGSGRFQTLSVKLYSLYISPSISNIPTTMTMAVLLFLFGLILLSLYGLILNKLLKGYK